MSDPTDVVERYLRDTFASDADAAPAPYDLTGEAVRRGRAHRRRTAVVGAIASVLVVAVGVAVFQELPAGSPAPPATSASPTPSDGVLEHSTPALLFRGVAVPVPAAYLDPDHMTCGQPVADAAYVVGDGQGQRSCRVLPVPGLTEVVMQDIANIPDVGALVGTHVLTDGRTQIASAVPGDGIWLTVTSPDPARARQLFDGTLVVQSWEGCNVQPAAPPTLNEPVNEPYLTAALPPLSGGAIGRVCGYRNGWLTGTALISGADLRELYALVTTAPSDVGIDCREQPPAGDGWWLTLGESRVWVQGRSCSRVIVDGGGSGRLTDTLVSRLLQLAPGPNGFQDLVIGKG